MDPSSIKAVLLALILTGGSLTIANTAQMNAPLKEKVVAVVKQEDTICYKIQDTTQDICYKIELPKEPKVEVVPSPQPIQTPTKANLDGVEQWRKLVAKYFPATEVDKILQVMQGESGGNPNAEGHNRNGSFDRGLLQVNSIHADKVNGDLDSLFDPETNLRVARQIWDSSGYGAWTVARKLGF